MSSSQNHVIRCDNCGAYHVAMLEPVPDALPGDHPGATAGRLELELELSTSLERAEIKREAVLEGRFDLCPPCAEDVRKAINEALYRGRSATNQRERWLAVPEDVRGAGWRVSR